MGPRLRAGPRLPIFEPYDLDRGREHPTGQHGDGVRWTYRRHAHRLHTALLGLEVILPESTASEGALMTSALGRQLLGTTAD